MFTSLILYLYRILAIGVVLTPVLYNVFSPSSITASLIYIPLMSLFSALIFIYFDNQLALMLKNIKTSVQAIQDGKVVRRSSISRMCKRILNRYEEFTL